MAFDINVYIQNAATVDLLHESLILDCTTKPCTVMVGLPITVQHANATSDGEATVSSTRRGITMRLDTNVKMWQIVITEQIIPSSYKDLSTRSCTGTAPIYFSIDCTTQ